VAPGKSNRAEFLKGVALFHGLSEKELNVVVARVLPRHYDPGQLMFSEGDPCEGLYIVESGEIRIFKTSPNGREQVLTFEGPGSSVAELPVFDGGTYPASAAAVTPTTALLIRSKDFHAICLENPEITLKVLRVVGGRLRRLVGIIEELSFTTVRHRVAALLLRLTKSEGKPTKLGVEFSFAMTHQELAAQVGTVRELVSRNLSRLQAAGIIRMEGKTVTVRDLEALEAEVEEGE
jgi:CRP/FNR family transcriptional regulator